MASSDDEGEAIPQSVTNYYFVDDKDDPISFSILPIIWSEDDSPAAAENQIFLHGTADSGLQKIYKQVIAWKLNLLAEPLEISVLSKDNSWIKIQKPRKSYEEIIRTILITVHCLHFTKKNPEALDESLWDHLRKIFSYEIRPSENDLLDHLPLISSLVKRNEGLAKSKFLLAFIDKPKKRKFADEDLQTAKFIVDGEDVDEETEDADESDAEPDSFDSVCTICDNGGELLCCEGRCLRSFHATKDAGAESQCASLGLSKGQVKAIQNFLCANCLHKQHQCFACGKLGSSDKSSGAEVFPCVSATCGHFYHPECVATLLHPGNEAEADEHQKKIASGESFTCPVHKCHVCKKGENKEDEDLQFAICRRCPKAYHRKCLPRKIAFEDIEEEDILQRAWDDLIPDRILIYCLNHTIDEDLGTPPRDHIIFPDIVEKKKARPLEKKVSKKKGIVSGDSSNEKLATMKLKMIGEKKDLKEHGSTKVSKKSPVALGELSKRSKDTIASKKLLKDRVSLSLKVEKSSASKDIKASLNTEKSTTPSLSKGLDSMKSKQKGLPGSNHEKIVSPTSVMKSSTMLPVINSEIEKKVMTIVKKSSSSVTLERIMRKHKVPSTHSYSSRHVDKTITPGKVEGSVEAVRTALQKLDEGCSIEDAKAVCGPDILNQIMKWKNKLKVYLSPFLYGMRYTSFGRHFTKVDKLKEIVAKLHPYVQSGDMVVDFCCGANDFSRLMKNRLEEAGKKCSFKNYDVIQPKDDFCFEKRDWMTVRTDELPSGSKLIMGLNPPFGVKSALANKFIDKALEFRPKLLILIVPKETERLDEKKEGYDLIWEDGSKLTGKSFYLPGSIDVYDKQMEQWNLKPPRLYLWSRNDWAAAHKGIAIREKHISKEPQESPVKENHEETQVNGQENHDSLCDIAKMLDDLSALKAPAEPLEETKTLSPEKQEDSPPKHDSVTDRSRHEDVYGKEGHESRRRGKNKRSRESFGERETEREHKKKQSRSKDEPSKGKHDSSGTKFGESYDRGTPTNISSPSKRIDSRSFLDNTSEPVDMDLEREGSEEGFLRSQHGHSASSEFGTRYAATQMTVPDDLDDIERRYRNRDDTFASGAWSTSSSSGIRGSEGRFPSYFNSSTVDNFSRNPYIDVHGRIETFGRPDVDPVEKYGQPSSDILRQVPPYGRPGLNDVPHKSWLQSDQDSGFNPMGSRSSYGLSTLAPDPSRLDSSVTQRYAPRLDEMNYLRPTPFTATEANNSSIFNAPGSRPADIQGFATGPHRHFPHHNSSGWLND